MDPRPVRVVLALLVFLAATGTASAAGGVPADGTPAARNAGREVAAPEQTLELVYTVERLPERPGAVKVTFRPRIPDAVERLRVTLDEGQTVTGHAGFRRREGRTWEWRGAGEARLTYVALVNRTAGGGYDAVDTREWTLTSRYRRTVGVAFHYWYRGATVGHVERIEPAGTGVSGVNNVFLGNYTLVERTAGDQRFRLVVPDAARMRSTTGAILDSLATAAAGLRIGGRDRQVTVFVAPPPMRGGGQTSEYSTAVGQDAWVHQSARVDTPNNVWIHEYVHTRQAYVPSERMAWLDEGSAEYYAAFLTLNAGDTDFETFRRHVVTTRYAGATLSDRSTWSANAVQYRKGAHVLAALDAEIRKRTDGERTLQDVMRRLNEHRGTVTEKVFRDAVAAVAGGRMDGWIDRYVDSPASPPVPDEPRRYVLSASADPDGDGLDGDREAAFSTSPFAADTDRDGLSDGREANLGTDPTRTDSDGDGIVDGTEIRAGNTDPRRADTDGDGIDDGAERRGETDPARADTDGDGLGDGREADRGADATRPDTDGDDLADGAEVDDHGTDPLVADSDGDGISDGAEVADGSDPRRVDTDGDGLDDNREASLGTDPAAETGALTYFLSVLSARLAAVLG